MEVSASRYACIDYLKSYYFYFLNIILFLIADTKNKQNIATL